VTYPSIHLPLDRLEPVDLTLYRAGTPPLGNPGPNGIDVASNALGQAGEFAVPGSNKPVIDQSGIARADQDIEALRQIGSRGKRRRRCRQSFDKMPPERRRTGSRSIR
jgi:hypothetical protein